MTCCIIAQLYHLKIVHHAKGTSQGKQGQEEKGAGGTGKSGGRGERGRGRGFGRWEQDEEEFEIFDKIVAFFEERPYFYDISHEAYSNRKRKDAEVAEFAKTIGWNGE